jgi:beta-glucosidase
MPTEPLFPFGHGLSYTRFAWHNFTVTPESFGADATLDATIEITNEGERAGTETVLLFSRDKVARVARPLLELKDFQQVTLAPGETAIVRFALPAKALSYPGTGPDFDPVLEPGAFEISVGPTAAHGALQTRTVTLE